MSTEWAPRSEAARLIAAQSSLDCYQPGSEHYAEWRFAVELPLALARAADDAARDGMEEEAHRLIALAYQVADILLPPADASPPALMHREWTVRVDHDAMPDLSC